MLQIAQIKDAFENIDYSISQKNKSHISSQIAFDYDQIQEDKFAEIKKALLSDYAFYFCQK